MADDAITFDLDPTTLRITVPDPDPGVSVLWDRAVQEAVVATGPGPTIASRAYALVHTAIFDAWASYDPVATAVSVGDALQRPAAENTEAAKIEAMSYAAYSVLNQLFPQEFGIFELTMAGLGFDPALSTPAEGSPAAVGLAVADALMAARLADGANQSGGYADTTDYAPVNAHPLAVLDIARWTPESVPIDPEDADPEQSFLTPHWGGVAPFALEAGDALRPPPPEPFFLPGVDATLDLEAGLIVFGGEAPPAPAEVTRERIGELINPAFVAQAEEVVAFSAGLTDEQKLIAEFWEDGPGTGFPPGSWMTFGQLVAAREDLSLDEEAFLFFALGNAVMDAGIAAWDAKTAYDYARPVRAIRDLGQLGLIGEAPGEGGEGFTIEAWGGPGRGTETIPAESFITYQTPGKDPSPPFAEYVSGHSTFSAAAAQVLRAITGSDALGASVTIEAGGSTFEPGLVPAEPVTLFWESFGAAADEAGISRLYGGIHFSDGDLAGRALGTAVGQEVWSAALAYAVGAAGADGGGEPEAPADVLALARLYEAGLARVPDPLGLNFWIDRLEAGDALADIAGAFLGSAERALLNGTPAETDAEFVAGLFAALGRDPDEDEALAGELLDGLADGESRAEALLAFAASELADGETAYLSGLAELEDGVWGFA